MVKNKDIMTWNTDSLRFTLALPLYLIFLVLLWHWNYVVVFWIFLALMIVEYASVTYRLNKRKKNLFK